MSKEKNLNDYAFAGDEKLTITADEFIALRQGINQGMNNGVVEQFPLVTKWYDAKTHKEVAKPTKKQIEEGKVKQFADPDATASEDNLHIAYNSNIFPHLYTSNRVLMSIFQRHVDEGVIPTIEEVKRRREERMNDGQMKVVSDEEE